MADRVAGPGSRNEHMLDCPACFSFGPAPLGLGYGCRHRGVARQTRGLQVGLPLSLPAEPAPKLQFCGELRLGGTLHPNKAFGKGTLYFEGWRRSAKFRTAGGYHVLPSSTCKVVHQESPSFAESCTAKANATKNVGSTSPAQEEACDVKIM